MQFSASSHFGRKSFYNFFERCKSNFSNEAKLFVDLSSQKDITEDYIVKKSTEFKVNSKIVLDNLKYIEGIRSSDSAKIIRYFTHFARTFENISDKGVIYRQNQKVLSFNKHDNSSLLPILMDIMISLRAENHARAKQKLGEILNKNFLRSSFAIDPTIFENDQMADDFIRSLVYAFEYVYSHLNNRLLAELALSYFSIFDNISILNKTSILSNWSLANVRSLMKKNIYRGNYILPWYYILSSKVQAKELNDYVRSVITIENINTLGIDLFPIFLKHFPEDVEKQKKIAEITLKNINTRDSFERIMIMEMLSQKEIRKILGNKIPKEYSRADFQIKREFFLMISKEKGLTTAPIFGLLTLDDYSKDLLWRLVF